MSKTVLKESGIVRVGVRESIKVVLTDEERAERAALSAKLQCDVTEQEETLRIANDIAKREIKQTKKKLAEAAEAYNTGQEFQKVDCVKVYDVKSGRVWWEYRGAKYAERPMYEDEKADTQSDLFGKTTAEMKASKDFPETTPRTAEEIAKDLREIQGQGGTPENLPADLANAGKKGAKVKKPTKAASKKAVEPEREDPRKDLGYEGGK